MACFSSGCWTKNRWVYTPPKSSILIGCSIIFTIHFGIPLFLETPIWPNGRIFYHQPRFPWNKRISLTKPSFGVSIHSVNHSFASTRIWINLPFPFVFKLSNFPTISSKHPPPPPPQKGRPTKNKHIFVPPQRKSQKGQAVRHPSSFMDSNSSTASASIQLP